MNEQLEEVKVDSKVEKLPPTNSANKFARYRDIIVCLGLTILSFAVRFQGIDRNGSVVWDEAHFGKFGSYYIKHEFYHDVHPPLGKMLIALSEWLAGFDGNFEFDSGKKYPDGVNFKFMRQFNATFGALCVPVVFFIANTMKLNWKTVYLVTLMATLEHSFIALSKFILLDSMLLFFTLTTFAGLVKLISLRKKQLTRQWSWWMLVTGLSIGCVCSVKWVGLFITVVVGVYTILDLFEHYCSSTESRKIYYKHWTIRIINLIIIPFLFYLFCFRIHFLLLYKSGTGDASTNTLFQINLEGSKIENGPRNVMFGSEVTIRSHGLSPNLLHSHTQLYPDGSRQRQVTGYGHSDGNNNWVIKFGRTTGKHLDLDGHYYNGELVPVRNGDILRLFHIRNECNLHSHKISSHVSKGNYEVSGYGTESIGDEKDDWVIEIMEQMKSSNPEFPEEDKDILHPVSTMFRLRHKELGCYLASTGLSYPTWGFHQAEIVCKYSWGSRDKSTWWNIENHWNDELQIDDDYVPPKSKFWTDFVLINFAMASSNNALVPDEDKYDYLASKAWEWPTLHKGLRLCGWSSAGIRYYLLGSPFNTWLSSIAIILNILIIVRYLICWRRQETKITEEGHWKFIVLYCFPLLAWLANFAPYVMMGRVTYVHHYMPSLSFAIIVFGSVLEYIIPNNKIIQSATYLILYAGCIYIYWYFAPICQGLEGVGSHYFHLQWLPLWDIAV
ncbi:Dolichyl-phosphate-mannose--protein mannosyltransferase 6 [Nakaseomyces bracarensis]|uniref:Dolichyl-phosphate-mannose--protein mannosyltransferase n=1 Tax=Nakaseomyces bracarensis TaxID=273131 RepID=A0ABR4NWG7_9SACH